MTEVIQTLEKDLKRNFNTSSSNYAHMYGLSRDLLGQLAAIYGQHDAMENLLQALSQRASQEDIMTIIKILETEILLSS